jgi:hypothetical protein
MPCPIKIKELLFNEVSAKSNTIYNLSFERAKALAQQINREYEEKVIYVQKLDTIEIDIVIPESLVKRYYESELKIELREIQLAEKEARAIQKADAERAGIEYSDDYLKDLNDDELAKVFTEEQIAEARDQEIAMKLGQKYKNAFGIDYKLVTAAEAAIILQDSPTPFTANTAAFFYGNQIYFIKGKFNSNSVIHEFSHPLIKGIQFQNPKLFENLFAQLSTSATGQAAIQYVKEEYPELEEGSIRFKEEAIVTAMEMDAEMKLNKVKSNDNMFNKFIQNLLYAIKQVIKALTKKVNLQKLNTNTSLSELVDMMINEDFVIEGLSFQPSLFAEFKKETDQFLKELKEATPENLIKTIDKFHNEMSFQLSQLRNSPKKLREELNKEDINLIKYIRDYVKGYKTPDEMTEEELTAFIDEIAKADQDLKLRSLAFVNSLAELSVFARRIEKIMNDLRSSKAYLTEEGNQKIQYYKQFMERQVKFLRDVDKQMNLDPSTEVSKKIYSIKGIMEKNIDHAKTMTFDYIKDFLFDKTQVMQANVKQKLVNRLDELLKADNYNESERADIINEILDKVNIDKVRNITEEVLGLPRKTSRFKYYKEALQNYNANKITEETIDDYLRGHVKDLGMAGAMLNPLGNINDLFGAFVKYMKNKLADAEVKSQQEQMRFAQSLVPYLNALNWNPNNTSQLADLLLFVDKEGVIDENGDYEEYEVYSYIDKFKNWRSDKAKLQADLKKAKIKGDREAIKEAMKAMRDFEQNYMVRRYTDEVYDVQNIWLQDNVVFDPSTKKDIFISTDVALEAYKEKKDAVAELSTYNSSDFTTLDDLLEFTPSAAAKIKYNNLFNLFDNNGNYKQGIELQKVLVRRYHREQSRKFNEQITNEERFQKDFDNFVNQELTGMGITFDSDPERYQAEVQKFMDKNTRIAYNDSYYQDRNRILENIQKINDKAKGADISIKLAGLYEQRSHIVNKVTDKDGEPNATELPADSLKRLKQIEEEIVSLQEEFDKKTGLSKEESKRLRYYEESIIGTGKASSMTAEQKQEYANLSSKAKAFGLSDIEISYLRNQFRLLGELTNVLPTEYYIDAFNTALGDADVPEITMDTADDWINSDSVVAAKAGNSRFAEWFDKNHYMKRAYNPNTEKYEDMYFRTKAWSVSRPSDAKYMKKTIITDPSTGEKIEINGIPVAKYSYTRIKDEYRTGYNPTTKKVELEVGVHIDNRGNFLPKELPLNDPNAKYMNEKYYEMKRAGGPTWQLLEAIKKERLKVQENSPYSARLYLDLARFRITENLEYSQSGQLTKNIKDKKNAIVDAVKSKVTQAEDDAERGANFIDKFLFVPTDLQGNPISRVPVRGMYKIDINSVSKDVLQSEFRYMNSLDMQKTLIEAEPTAKALIDVLGDPENALDRLNVASSTLSKAQDKAATFLKRETNNRLQVAKDFMDRTFYGQKVSEFQEENPVFSKLVRGSMGAASFAFYNLNPVSTLKNKLGMNFQKLVYTAGGKYISFSSIARGKLKANKVLIDYATRGAYSRGVKNPDLQLADAFDMSPGKAQKDTGKSISNTATKQFFDGAWLYSDRKLTEYQGALELGFSLLDWQMVDQIQPDGSVVQIRYTDAFEEDADGIVKLKTGINPEWGMNYVDHIIESGETLESIAKKYHMSVEDLMKKNKLDKNSKLEEGQSLVISRNEKFNMMKLRIASANKKLNGTVSEIDQPTAEKYLLYDVFSFSRKFGTGMFLSRFQTDTSKDNRFGEVWDWDLDETTKGKYVSFLQTTYRLLTDAKNYYPIMTPEEKSALKEILTEGMMLAFMGLAIALLFGFDGGDEDRFKKLRERQEKYGIAGWMANHMLYQLIMVQKENSTMIPLPGMGAGDWLDFTKTSTIAMGPTIELYLKIVNDLRYMITGNDKAVYKQDVGPYTWQEEGHYKLWNHLGSVLGLSGKNFDPVWAIKKNEIFTNLKG